MFDLKELSMMKKLMLCLVLSGCAATDALKPEMFDHVKADGTKVSLTVGEVAYATYQATMRISTCLNASKSFVQLKACLNAPAPTPTPVAQPK